MSLSHLPVVEVSDDDSQQSDSDLFGFDDDEATSGSTAQPPTGMMSHLRGQQGAVLNGSVADSGTDSDGDSDGDSDSDDSLNRRSHLGYGSTYNRRRLRVPFFEDSERVERLLEQWDRTDCFDDVERLRADSALPVSSRQAEQRSAWALHCVRVCLQELGGATDGGYTVRSDLTKRAVRSLGGLVVALAAAVPTAFVSLLITRSAYDRSGGHSSHINGHSGGHTSGGHFGGHTDGQNDQGHGGLTGAVPHSIELFVELAELLTQLGDQGFDTVVQCFCCATLDKLYEQLDEGFAQQCSPEDKQIV
ncbi:MAG: hypothetical protein MHM6MM_008260, partial [Cercozoa sp. M6MM]